MGEDSAYNIKYVCGRVSHFKWLATTTCEVEMQSFYLEMAAKYEVDVARLASESGNCFGQNAFGMRDTAISKMISG